MNVYGGKLTASVTGENGVAIYSGDDVNVYGGSVEASGKKASASNILNRMQLDCLSALKIMLCDIIHHYLLHN